jgi:hypothetical protein
MCPIIAGFLKFLFIYLFIFAVGFELRMSGLLGGFSTTTVVLGTFVIGFCFFPRLVLNLNPPYLPSS